MIGAIIGDIVGSRFEFHNTDRTDFAFFHPKCTSTDDSIMTLAIADALLQATESNTLDSNENMEQLAIDSMRKWGRKYPGKPYGDGFKAWLKGDGSYRYSYGNGGAMRVSAVGWVADSEDDALRLAEVVTKPSHNSPEAILAAQVVALAIFYARQGYSKEKINDALCGTPADDGYLTSLVEYSQQHPKKNIIEKLKAHEPFDMSGSHAVDVATQVFFSSDSYEETIRNAVAEGGDSDTIACIAGAMAEAYYGVPDELRLQAYNYFDAGALATLSEFEKAFPPIIYKHR